MKLIDTATAAYLLRVGERQVQRHVRQGRLTNHGTPRAIRVDVDEVTALARRGSARLRHLPPHVDA